MLADTQIRDFISKKKIRIQPFHNSLLSPGYYNVRLGTKVLVPEKDQIIDLSQTKQPKYKEINISKSGYILKSKKFILGETKEAIGIDKDIGVLLSGKSTLSRLGLSIHQDSMFIRPGQRSHVLTLEIFNASDTHIKLTPNIKVAELIFFQYSQLNKGIHKSIYKVQKRVVGANVSSFVKDGLDYK